MGNCMPLPSSSRRIRSVPSASFHSRPPDGSTNTSTRNRLMGSQGPCKQRRHAAMALDSILGRVTMDLTQHYDLGNELGRGRFGLIRQCTNKLTGESFACKSISKLKLTRMKDVEDVRREIDIMRDLSAHPNVVKLKDVYEDKAYVHLIMELCEGGELFDRIAKRRTYPEKEAALLFKTLVEVVKYCHEMGVIHRDLKPENILLVNSSSSSPIKLADFGLALRFTRGETFSGTAGSAYYIAPEVLSGNYSEEVDVWSAGVILYILLCGTAPFWGETDESIFEAIKEGKIDFTSAPMGNISMAAKDLINRMLCPNPKARLMPAEILKHPWILRHTTKPEQDDGRNTRQDSSQEATCWRTKSGEADESVANPGGKENMEEISAAQKETCLPKGLSDEQASLTTMATDYLLPECSPDLQATPEFAFQSGAADEAPEALSFPLCEGKAESTFIPYSFTQPASALSISPSSFVSSEAPSPDSFDRWASSSLGAGFKFSEFLAAIFARLDTVHLPPVWGHSQVHEQDKAIVRVDSADQGKFMVLHDRSRWRVGWMVLPSLSDSQACFMGLIPPSSSLHNSHTFYKLVWSSQDAAFVLALPLSYTPHKNLNQALRVDDLPACILSLYKTLSSTQPTDFSSPTFLTAHFGSYLAPSNYVQICF